MQCDYAGKNVSSITECSRSILEECLKLMQSSDQPRLTTSEDCSDLGFENDEDDISMVSPASFRVLSACCDPTA